MLGNVSIICVEEKERSIKVTELTSESTIANIVM